MVLFGQQWHVAPWVGLVLVAGAATAAQAQNNQPRAVDVRPAVQSTLEKRAVVALRLQKAMPGSPQALCDVWGLRSSVPTEVLQGSLRQAELQRLGVPASEMATDLAQPWVVLRCMNNAPDGAQLSLRWLRPTRAEPGTADVGTASWDAQRFDFQMRSDWPVSIQCNRANAGVGCNPLEVVSLQFTQAVQAADLAQVRLRDTRGALVAPQWGKAGQPTGLVDNLPFAGLAAEATYEIVWPPSVRDKTGADVLAQARQRAGLKVAMGPYPALAKFAAPFGIAERATGGVVPLTVRAIEGLPQTQAARLRTLRVNDEASIIEAYQALVQITRRDDSAGGMRNDEEGDFEPDVDAVTPNSAASAASAAKPKARRFDFPTPPPKKADEGPVDTRGISWLRPMRDSKSMALPRALEAQAFEVLGIPLTEPGLHLLEVESLALGRSLLSGAKPMFVRSGAFVTDLGVHLHHSSRTAAVWVTQLSTGQPVAGAQVSVYDCRAKRLVQGRTGAQGNVSLELPATAEGESGRWGCPLFVFARTPQDLGLVLSSWQRGIESWRFEALNNQGGEVRDDIAHAVLARNLLRPGETLHARLYWRHFNAQGQLAAPSTARLPRTAALIHQGSGERRSVPLTWDARGNADLVHPLPSGAKRGSYSVELGTAGEVGTFRLEEFRLPVLKAEVASPPQAQTLPVITKERPANVDVALRLSYLSGGPAAGETIQVSQRLLPFTPRFAAFGDYWFGSDSRFRFEAEGDEQALATEIAGAALSDDKAHKLDAAGAVVVSAQFKQGLRTPKQLLTEMEYRDPNGETYRAQGRTALWPAAIALGTKVEWWSPEAQRKVDFVTVNLQGQPQANVAVEVTGGFDGYVTTRQKTVGGFYSYHSERREFKAEPLCKGRTDAQGRFTCRFTPAMEGLNAGQFRVQGVALDGQGRRSVSDTSLWVYGGGELWFTQADHDRMDVLADKPRFKPGEVATLQVRSPFREATAWVSVLRSGVVVDTLVVPLSGKQPVIKLPIKASYAPNVFINVMAVRGRVAEPAPTALVDLARPAFKLGVLPLEVGAEDHLLKVKVATDKPSYAPRDTARVSIKVAAAQGALAADREATVFAIDEALLELWPNGSWELFKAMLAQRGYGFESASAAMQVMGKRHYGRKALPAGGGGGRSATRELFETLLLYRGTVALDADGQAQVDVPVNDSLTRFRVVVVANAGASQFGTGEASFVSTKDLQVLPGLPAAVREGDRFNAGFTVRNRSGAPLQATVDAQMNGTALPRQRVALAPNEAKVLTWPVVVPAQATELQWKVEALAAGSTAGASPNARQDAVALRIPVGTALQPLRYVVGVHELKPGAEPVASAVLPPAGSVPGRGEVRVSLSPDSAADATGVRDYMRQYPFFCLEQRTSKAVSLKDPALWRVITEGIDRYITPNGLVTYYPEEASSGGGYDVLTSFVLSASHEAGWQLPQEARQQMLGGLTQFVRGQIERRLGYGGDDPLDLTERKLLALEAIARHGPVDMALLESLRLNAKTDLPQWSHRALVQWLEVLNRLAGPQVNAAQKAAWQTSALAELDTRLGPDGRGGLRLRARAQEQRWYFMSSEATSQVRLALLALQHSALKDRAGALARGAVNQQRNGAAWWETQANVWGSLLLDQRAQQATGKVSGHTTIAFGQQTVQHDWARQPLGESYRFSTAGLSSTQPGAVALAHRGPGQPVAQAEGTGFVAVSQPKQQNAELSRQVRPIKVQVPGRFTAGDIVEIKLSFKTSAESGWVVLNEPIPAGATVLGSGLKGQAEVPAAQGKRRGWRHEDGSWEAYPSYVERTFTHLRSYYEYLWGGTQTFTYQLRLNNAGQFQMPPSALEAMYDPDIQALLPNATWEVK